VTIAIALIKGGSGRRESTFNFLTELSAKPDPFENQVKIDQCLISFGWPDFVLLLSGKNVELIKDAIIKLREMTSKWEDNLDTSTIICTTAKEIENAKIKLKEIVQ